jgi:rhamnosyltransferase
MTAESHPSPRVSVVIPVLNAAAWLPQLLEALFAQQPHAPEEVLLVDSMSTDDTRGIAAKHPKVRVLPIADFSHGRARNLGAREARGEVVVLMSQDALPVDERWLAELLAPLDRDASVAATFSRQIPRAGASPMECFFLRTRFPAGEPLRRERVGGEVLTLEKVFFSNVSAAARRELLLAHPFDEQLIMSEDQQWARDVLLAGYATVYQPSSVVLHSHDYSLLTVLRRYFDSVHSLTLIFSGHGLGTSASMGLSYLARETAHMIRHHPLALPYYALYTLAKTSGTLLGHVAEHLPRALQRRLSFHAYHWRD